MKPLSPGSASFPHLAMQRRQRSPPTGGCTFPENPAHSCALVLPIWSAAADPRVLAVRASPCRGRDERSFDFREADRVVRSPAGEHVLIDRDGPPFRLDIIEGTVLSGPTSLSFDLSDDDRLEDKLAVIRAFVGKRVVTRHHLQLAGRLQALHAADARTAGASLREIAELILGPGDWPGDGEYRKSLIRRMISSGKRMVQAGPHIVLAGSRRNDMQLTRAIPKLG
jgi:hypothetical protein